MLLLLLFMIGDVGDFVLVSDDGDVMMVIAAMMVMMVRMM